LSTSRISLPDRYRVVRHVANGGMASVWEAHDELLDRSVAVKVLGSHLSEDDRARQRFQREARAAAGLSNHPHVVTIYDVGEHDGRTFMVMELLRGGTVSERLKAGERIPPRTSLRWLREAAGALDAAHDAGVVHRDVKPGNMLLDEQSRLALADFGIARLALEDQLTLTGQVLGTASYISPEQAIGEGATAASDRYALAVVAFELLTGTRPFSAENFAAQARAHVEDPPPVASEVNGELPHAVDAVLARGLAKDPDERWPSSIAFVDALEEAMDTRAVPATGPTRKVSRSGGGGAAPPPLRRSGPRRPPRRRGPVLLAALALLAAAAVAAAIALAGGNGGDGNSPRAKSTSTPKPKASSTPKKKAKRTPSPTPTDTATPEPTATATATASPTQTATPKPPPSGGKPDLAQARRLQVQGYNARQGGDYQKDLELAQQALNACGNSKELDPCGYALFEKGLALNRLGRSEEAIPVLQQRLARFGDNNGGEVGKELKDAQKKAGKD
jgi:eukaryotic-like serine/threonine-protein kinase